MKTPLDSQKAFSFCSLFLRLRSCRSGALLELVDAASGVEDGFLARVERVRGRGNFNLEKVVFLAFELALLRRLDGRTDQKLGAVADIFEDDRAKIGWMDVCFHKEDTNTGFLIKQGLKARVFPILTNIKKYGKF